MTKNKRLGRGLDALFGGVVAVEGDIPAPMPQQMGEEGQQETGTMPQETNQAGVVLMPVEFLQSGAMQPRQHFDEVAIEELAVSITKHGVLQPLLVRELKDTEDRFEIIAGERRWRAAQKANLHEIPVIIQSFTDIEALEIGLIENIQREDLTAIEEAKAYQRLINEFGYTQNDLGDIVGKSRSHVTNILRLLKLPTTVQNYVDEGTLSMGHARAILTAENPESVAKFVIKKKLSVRQTEHYIQSLNDGKGTKQKISKSKEKRSADVVALERDLQNLLGYKVTITNKGQKGTVVIEYNNLDQFDDILRRLTD